LLDIRFYDKYTGEFFDISADEMDSGKHYFGFTKTDKRFCFMTMRSYIIIPPSEVLNNEFWRLHES